MKTAHVILLFAALIGKITCLLQKEYYFEDKELSWSDAQTHCRNNYEDLLSINSLEELTKFKEDVGDDFSFRGWSGLYKNPDQTTFGQWSDGSEFEFAEWRDHQPDQPYTQHCAYIENAELGDLDCEKSLPFFCYTMKSKLIMVQERKTWHEALAHCRAQYTDLISLDTEKDFLEVNKLIGSIQNASVWTGLTFLDGSWFWVNKKPLTNPVSLPSCPIRPFFCGAKIAGNVLENRDCMEKMSFVCYDT